MRSQSIVLATLLVTTVAVPARGDDAGSPATHSSLIRPFVGAYIPTGKQSDVLKTSVLTGVQLGYQLPSPLRLVGSVAWTPSEAKDFSNTRTNILQYDAGAELGPRSVEEDVWKFGPFVGLGVGGRTYRFKGMSASDQTNLAGYGSIGGEAVKDRFGARVELRDYVSRFQEIGGSGATSTRNDMMATGALTFHL
jgi:hypothetical protein